MKILLSLLLALLLPLATSVQALTEVKSVQAPAEARKIDAMIASVEQLPGAVFIRNGSEYGGKQAADHLRMKLRYAGKKVRTAEDFIKCCASESSMTGRKYKIRFADGHTVDSEIFFHEQLHRIEAGAKPIAQKPAAQPSTAKLH